MASIANRPVSGPTQSTSSDYLCYRRRSDGSLCTTPVTTPGAACPVHRGQRRALSIQNEGDVPAVMPPAVAAYFESPVYPHPEFTPT